MSGFTLLEVLVAVTVLALAATMATPALGIGGERGPDPVEVVRALTSDAAKLSVAEGRTVRLVLDPATGRWWRDANTKSGVSGELASVPSSAWVQPPERVGWAFDPEGAVWGTEEVRMTRAGDTVSLSLDVLRGRVTVR